MITSHKETALKSDKNKASVSQRRSKTLLQDNRHDNQNTVQKRAQQHKAGSNDKQKSSVGNVSQRLSVENQASIQLQKHADNNGSSSNTGEIIQCIPFWKKAATATAAIGSGALLAGGLMSSATLAPLAIAAGGIGLLGSAAYASYKGYHEHDRSQTFNNVQTELDQYQPATNPNITHLNKTTGISKAVVRAPIGVMGVGPAGPLGNRRYGVEINTNKPTGVVSNDQAMRASAMTHETTHIAVDQGYNFNATRTTNVAPQNLTTAEIAAINLGTAGNREEVMEARVYRLMRTVRTDKQVPNVWKQYISDRLDYIVSGTNVSTEYDTVVNELLHFMKLKGMEADSKTAQEITAMAKENHARR